MDDLDNKPWFGSIRDPAFDGLRQAFGAALALRAGGLGFVVTPLPTLDGEPLVRLAPRHSVALHPFVDERPGTFGEHEPEDRAAVIGLLADLHRAKAGARVFELGLPGRAAFESVLAEVHGPWSSGPLAEAARDALARHASDWDTVALAPRERDLWMVVGAGGDDLAAYVEATGHRPDPASLVRRDRPVLALDLRP